MSADYAVSVMRKGLQYCLVTERPSGNLTIIDSIDDQEVAECEAKLSRPAIVAALDQDLYRQRTCLQRFRSNEAFLFAFPIFVTNCVIFDTPGMAESIIYFVDYWLAEHPSTTALLRQPSLHRDILHDFCMWLISDDMDSLNDAQRILDRLYL